MGTLKSATCWETGWAFGKNVKENYKAAWEKLDAVFAEFKPKIKNGVSRYDANVPEKEVLVDL